MCVQLTAGLLGERNTIAIVNLGFVSQLKLNSLMHSLGLSILFVNNNKDSTSFGGLFEELMCQYM